jgi:hypothetical protein
MGTQWYSRVLEGTCWRAVGGGGVLVVYCRILPRYRSGYWRARLLRHGRGAARAVPSCAGAYVSGAAGSNTCPAGSGRIETEAACRTAAAAAGKTPGFTGSIMNDFLDRRPFVGSFPAYPRGCYYDTANTAFFNIHAVGGGYTGYRLLCAGLTTGAPPTTLGRTTPRVCLSK